MIPRTSKLIASFALRLEKRHVSKPCALDLGCGSGYIGNTLSLRGFSVDCADSDKNALSFAKKNLPKKFIFMLQTFLTQFQGKNMMQKSGKTPIFRLEISRF